MIPEINIENEGSQSTQGKVTEKLGAKVEICPDASVVKEELFGPLLYVMKFQVFYLHCQFDSYC